MSDISSSKSEQKPTADEVNETVAFVDGVLGSAGHKITDTETRDILRDQAAGEITGDEARAAIRQRHGLD